MNILYKLATLATLLIVTITAEAQTAPPAGTPVITLTVANNATIKISTNADATNTPVWLETTPGTYTPTTVGTLSTGKSIDVTGITLKVHGTISEFYCGGNKEKLTALDVSKNTALTNLYCDNNQITTLDVANNTALATLNCVANKLTSLDVSKNTALTNLYCNGNSFTALDVSKNIALKDLRCNYNRLTALDVSKNTALKQLECWDNQLTMLDVSKNTALTSLSCGSNQLTALDVSKNTALTDLGCNWNKLTALDVSKNTALTELSCRSNQLTALDVSKNTAMTNLYCDDNQLTALNLSKNTALRYMYCYQNPLNATAIDALYCSLPNRAAVDKATIYLAHSSNDSNRASILISNANNATTKNWAVKYYSDKSNIPTTGSHTCGSILVPSTEVILNKATATIEISKTAALTATVKPDNATYKAVAWRCSNTTVATVDDKGIVTGVSIGSATITAKAVDGGAEAKCIIAVTIPAGTPVITLTVASNANIKLFMSAAAENTPAWVEATPGTYTPITVGISKTYYNYTATGTSIKVYGAIKGFSCGKNNEKLTALDVSNNTALTYLDCSSNQLIALNTAMNTALTQLDCGNNRLTALDVSKNTALTKFECYNNPLTMLDISKNTALSYLSCNNSRMTTTAIDALYCSLPHRTAEDKATMYLAYSSSDDNHASILISNANNATTKNWAVKYYSDKSNIPTTGNYTCGSILVPSTEIILNKTTATIEISKTIALTATMKPDNATYKDIAWSSSNTAVATVDDKGIVTTVSTGTATITAKAVEGGAEAKCEVTVVIPVTLITLDKTAATMEAGKTVALTATVKPDNSTNKALAWSSSNTAVATVDSYGTVTGVSAGTATITAKAVDGGFEAKCEVTVVTPVTLITLDKSTATVEAGKTTTITATVKPDNASNKAVTWSSSNSAVATVDGSGIVTGVSAGTATITAKAVDGGALARCEVTVTSTTGVETETTSTLCLYPNPATAEVFIKGIEMPTLVEVYSTMGQLMLSQMLAPTQSISISHLLPGVYTVKVNGIAMKLMVAGR